MSFLIKYYSRNCIKKLRAPLKNVRLLSTKVQEVHTEEESPVQKVTTKKPQRPPFMKNLFVGVFDTELLGFPEVLNNEQYKQLNDRVSQVNHCFSTLNSSDIDNSKKIPSDVLDQLRNLSLFGLQVPGDLRGLELSETENCRILEVISQCPSIATSIVNHQYLGVHVIASKNNKMLKNKYLSRLCNGEDIAAFCLLEENCLDLSFMTTNAKLSEDGNSWILNGRKSWVVNGSQGNVYIVLTTLSDTNAPNVENRIKLFLVDKNCGGITAEPCQNFGMKGADICHVNFENTVVPVENMLSDEEDHLKSILPLLSKLRLSTGPMSAAILRKLINNFSNYSVHNKHGQKYLMDYDFIRDKIAQVNINLYAIESLTYFTAGLLDRYERQDCDLESSIVKTFSSEKCLESIEMCMKLMGMPAFMDDHWIKPLLNDAVGLVVMNETNESLRLMTSLLGLQFAGAEMNDAVKKSRNPLFFPGFVVRKMLNQRRHLADDPKLELGLEDYLHPSLTHSARWLEYCVYRLQYAAETMLIRHGPEIIEQHMELKKLADVATDIYTMVAVLSRASRSYCIGLRNADCEMLLANAFCLSARDRVKNTVADISRGPYNTNDLNYQQIAKRAFKWHGYFAEHALQKNF